MYNAFESEFNNKIRRSKVLLKIERFLNVAIDNFISM